MRFVHGWPALAALLLLPGLTHADTFDHYTNPLLAKALKSKSVEKVTALTPERLVEHSHALPGVTGAVLIVKTNEDRLARLLVLPARQKVAADKTVPILLVERFVTYREGEERAVTASGQNVRLFPGFHFSLDLGQIVPTDLGGDLRYVEGKDGPRVEPVGKAELYLVTKHLPEATPKKSARPVIGEKFEPRFFDGEFKLYDDGRRSGTLRLKVADNGIVSGDYFSDKDGRKYDVEGKVGSPPHAIRFMITFPRSLQTFQGMMFTGDARAIVGTSRLQERETGFYAVRVGSK